MKYLTALQTVVALLAGIGASDAAVRIVEDAGGRIGTYVDKYQGVRNSGDMVIIDGFCASACTVVLGTVPHERICVTSRARLGFHAAWDSGSRGRKITNPEATQTLYSMYPVEVRRWIDQRGGLTMKRRTALKEEQPPLPTWRIAQITVWRNAVDSWMQFPSWRTTDLRNASMLTLVSCGRKSRMVSPMAFCSDPRSIRP